MDEKICKRCGQLKHLNDYRKNKNLKDGHETQCRVCRREIGVYSDRSESRLIKKKKWVELNREINLEYFRKWKRNNPEKFIESVERSYKNNRLNKWFNGTKGRAIKNGLEFNLDLEDFEIPEYCPILGIKLEFNEHGFDKTNKSLFSGIPSIDRIDNSKGYVKGNTWIISRLANTMKNKGSFENLYRFSRFFNQNLKEEDNKYVLKYNGNTYTDS